MKITVVRGGEKLSGGVVMVRLGSELERSYCERVDGELVWNFKVSAQNSEAKDSAQKTKKSNKKDSKKDNQTASKSKMTRRKWMLLVREIVRGAKAQKFAQIAIDWSQLTQYENIGDDLNDNLAEVFAQNALMADYEFRTYKTKPADGWNDLHEIVLIVSADDLRKVRPQIKVGVTIADAVNVCRDLANTPGEDMTPKILVRKTRSLLRKLPVKVKVLGEREMSKKKMNGVLTVGRGSKQESQFIVLEYLGDTSAKTAPTVLVGKGVTFDSGGIDAKPHPHGCEMMMDMSGGAAVIATMLAVAQLKLRKNIIALIPAVENMGSGNSMRPGDIIRMMDGTTVEIGHTDAEGRIILADALTFAQKYQPQKVIDVATLTGASLAALGERASAIFTTDDEFAQTVSQTGEQTGDFVWRLPLWDEYDAEIKGTHGDISNISKSRYGGAITAAAFLKHFVKDDLRKNWMHIDIAPTMTTTTDEHLAKGAKGSPVRLLVGFLRKN